MNHVLAPVEKPLIPEARDERAIVLAMGRVHGTQAEIGLDQSIYDPASIAMNEDTAAGRLSVVAEMALPVIDDSGAEHSAHAAVVMIRESQGKDRLFICGLDTDETGTATANGTYVRLHGSLVVGRSGDVPADSLWKNTRYGDDVSRRHITFRYYGHALHVDETSMNGTMMAGQLEDTGYGTNIAEHTENANSMANKRGLLSPDGRFAGRTVIHRDSTVGEHGDGTVDIRSWQAGGEAIVVDSRKDSEPYEKMYQDFLTSLPNERGDKVSEKDILKAIHETVGRTMSYDLPFVEQTSERLVAKQSDSRKVNLGFYLHNGKGVCRQMALAAAWLSSEAVYNGLLTGRGTAEVNQSTTGRGAHEWMRYTALDGSIFIIDPAQKYFGPLNDPNAPNRRWEYYRPGERKKLISRQLGQSAFWRRGR